ncbi:MAG: response regulator [Paracoccaceae bacterium]
MTRLKGKHILIVEDEALLGVDLLHAIAGAGAGVTGPCRTLGEAMRAARSTVLSAAVLDVELQGEMVYPLADLLGRRGVPFVFHTGSADMGALRARYTCAPICKKPSPGHLIVEVLLREISAP